VKNCQGQCKKDTTGVIKRGKLCQGQYKKDTTEVIKYPMSNHLGCLIQTKSEKLSGAMQKRYHWSNQKRKTLSGTIQRRYHWSNQIPHE
jgi:hypothetical protein